MVFGDVDPVIGELDRLVGNPSLPSFLNDQIKNLQLELRFLKVFFWCFAKWDDAAKDARLGTLVTDIAIELRKAGKGLYAAGLIAIQRGLIDNWNLVVSNLMEKVESFKPEVAEICVILLDHSCQCNFCTSYEILEFIGMILENLKDIVNSKAIISGPMEMQIRELQQILWVLKSLFDFAATWAIAYDKLEDIRNHVQGCANRAASVSLLFWVRERVREEDKSRIDGVLSDLVQKIEPFTPGVIGMYLGILKASKSSRPDTSLIGEVVASFLDVLLKNLQVSKKDDITHELGEGLMFLLTFLMDPPELSEAGGNLIWRKVDAIVSDIASFICSFRVDQRGEQENEFPVELFQRIDQVKAEIKDLYVQISHSSLSDFPKTNGLGYITFLLGKIGEMLKCDANVKTFGKYQIVAIQKELLYLQSSLKQRNEHEDIWMQIINVAYRAELVIDTSLIMDGPIWHCMILLSDVMEQMKLIKLDIEKTEAKQTKVPVVSYEKMSPPRKAKFTSSNMVGFDDEIHRIMEELVGGSLRVGIVSIVGMPGIGKTTLAMKVFDDPLVRYHFSTCLWCHVSQVHNRRNSLLNMLNSVSVQDKLTSLLNDDQLAERLYRCLKGKRFLIVLDDIWDIKVWHELRMSFPDDGNGSRILFTSRILNVALEAKPNKHPHFLHPLSDEESWKMLKEKLFSDNVWPAQLLEVGQRIAKNCQGLPLVIELIAGVLARKENMQLWESIARDPISLISSKGLCMDTLEPSYKHLPDVLRSCFLYLATFPMETVIKVKRLCRLWIAEGFVPQSKGKSLEEVANQYLMDLISRNLVIVDNRSFNLERIKECHVHGLLHYFCVTKAEEEGFSKLVKTSRLQPNGVNYKHYRLCIQPEWSPFVNSKPIGPNVRSLLFRPGNSSNKHPYTPEFFKSFQFLGVLDLEGLQWGVLFPQEVIWLTYLRYLAVTGDFTSIPSSIDNLSYLETLYIRSHDSVIVLPNTICKMKSLRNVDIPTGATIYWDDYDHEKSSCLNNLVTFSLLIISRREDREMLFKMFPRVRRLRFQFSNRCPALDFLDHPESLNVQKFGRAPNSYLLEFSFSLRELTLSNLRLPWEEMSAIVKVPNLEALKLLSRSFEGLHWDMRHHPLCKLKFLKLESLNVEEWTADPDSLPCLERLVVKDCVNLEEVPYDLLESLTLKIIEVDGCSSSLAKSAKKYGDFYDHFQVIITSKVAEEHSSSSHVSVAEKSKEDMTIKPAVRITEKKLVVKDWTVLTNVPDNMVVTSGSESGPVEGVFLGAAFHEDNSRHVVSLGTLRDMRFLACFRFKLWWMAQKMGDKGRDIPLETQFLLVETKHGSHLESDNGDKDNKIVYTVFLPLIEGPFRAVLQGNSDDELEMCLESGDSATVRSTFTHSLYIGAGTDPFGTITDAISAVKLHLKTFRMRHEKNLPGILDYLGWCTWDAFYGELTEEGLDASLESLAAGGTPPNFVIIDDGWQSVGRDESAGEQKQEEGQSKKQPPSIMGLSRIKENSKFQENYDPTVGLKNIVNIAKQKHGLKYVYVWHSIPDYWDDARQGVKENDALIPIQGVGLANPKDVYEFYNDWHSCLAFAGVDGVKVDVQCILENLGAGLGSKVELTRQYHQALDASIARNFPDNGCIACMSHSIDALYSSKQTAVVRASDDFFPRDPISHTIHVASVAYNSIFLGEFMQPDWDMFHSLHPAAEFHGSARAISGGPLYISDVPGKHSFDLLKKLVLPDGSILRARLPGRPTKDCLFSDPARDGVSLLKIWNVNKYTGVLGVYNCQGAAWNSTERRNTVHQTKFEPITGYIRGLDVHLIAEVAMDPEWNGDCAVYRHKNGELITLPKSTAMPVSLKVLEHEIFTVTPIKVLAHGYSFAPLGLIYMYNAGGAIESLMYEVKAGAQLSKVKVEKGHEGEGSGRPAGERTENVSTEVVAVVSIQVKGCGMFGAYSSAKPRKCTIGSSFVDFAYDSATGLVTFDLVDMPPEEQKVHIIEVEL